MLERYSEKACSTAFRRARPKEAQRALCLIIYAHMRSELVLVRFQALECDHGSPGQLGPAEFERHRHLAFGLIELERNRGCEALSIGLHKSGLLAVDKRTHEPVLPTKFEVFADHLVDNSRVGGGERLMIAACDISRLSAHFGRSVRSIVEPSSPMST